MGGFDDLNKLLKEIQKKVENANGEVSFPDLFNPNFMTTFTNFSDIDEFFKKSPFEIHDQDEFENLDDNELDQYVSETTRFSSWDEMKAKAGELYMKHKLGL
jgi:hypothetical protein